MLPRLPRLRGPHQRLVLPAADVADEAAVAAGAVAVTIGDMASAAA